MDKTALEPGDPIGVDPAKDELAFYPLIYWPIDPDASMPSPEAIARVDAYMQQGGTVLFDTRDQLQAGASLDPAASPASQRLRAILDRDERPPLEPVPDDHVLTKASSSCPIFRAVMKEARSGWKPRRPMPRRRIALCAPAMV